MGHGGGRVALGVLLAALAGGCTVVVRDGGPLPPPRPVVVVGPPRLVLIAGTGIHWCPDIDDDVFFYGDVWYTYRLGIWYHAPQYSGPWVVVERGRLPQSFIKVPPGQFKHRPEKFHPAHEHYPDLDTWDNGDDGGGPGRGGKRGHKKGRGWKE